MKKLFEFTPTEEENFVLPKDIIQYQCDELSNMTNQLIIGKVEEYESPIEDYTTGVPSFSASLVKSLGEKVISIQSELGELSGNEFTYEFFITSKYTTNFIYRILFLRHGISIYPTRVVLDETIADQIGVQYDCLCHNEEEFTQLLAAILNSQKFKDVINNLFSINKKAEIENNTESN